MLTRVIDDIAGGKSGNQNAAQRMLDLKVAKLPEIQQDNTDRNRTSPFAFTGMKFEFRAVGSSQSIAFPVMLLNAAVAEAIAELSAKLRKKLHDEKMPVDDAVLAVVAEAFRETKAIRFEGNGYSNEWVDEAARRGLPNHRRTPEALEQLVCASSQALFSSLGILSHEELESRFHVRMERYVKDMLIEMTTLKEMVDTLVLPAGLRCHGELAQSAAAARAAGITIVPQVAQANHIGTLVQELQARRDALVAVLDQAEGLHHDPTACAKLLTGAGADAMAAVRDRADALELQLPDELWPLPKYREMLFPV
jgi:glutamine synthetase